MKKDTAKEVDTIARCKHCNAPLPSKRHPKKVYCNGKCKYAWHIQNTFKRVTYNKRCKSCGRKFTTTYKRQIYCESECRELTHQCVLCGEEKKLFMHGELSICKMCKFVVIGYEKGIISKYLQVKGN